jgi:molybdopterin synthase catalytic subunit
MIDVRVQAADFDPGRQLARLEALGNSAVASYVAIADCGEQGLQIEHFPALAKNELAAIAAEADERWPLAGLILIHRHGRLSAGERLGFAAVAAPGRADAIAACAFLVEALATRAPFWRREILSDGDSGRSA